MNKKIILLLCMILLVGTISALEFDNVKSYDELTKTVTIENVFGLGADIAKIKLNTPLVVTTGYGGEFKVAEFEVTSLTDYTDAFGDMKFYNVNDNLKEIEKEIKYKVRSYEDFEVEDYAEENVCSLLKNGTNVCNAKVIGIHTEQREVWNDLGKADFLDKEVKTIGIFAYVNKGDYVEWIPNFYGVKISEWASWTADLNTGLLHYYKLDDNIDSLSTTNMTETGTPVYNSGLIGNNLDGGTSNTGKYLSSTTDWDIDGGTVSFSVWVDSRGAPTVGPDGIVGTCSDASDVCYMINYFETGPVIQWNRLRNGVADGLVSHTVTLPTIVGTYNHFVGTYDGTNMRLYVNGTLVAGPTAYSGDGTGATTRAYISNNAQAPGRYFNGEIDEVGVWNRALTTDEITYLYNSGDGCAYGDDACGINAPTPTVVLDLPTAYENYTDANILAFDVDVYTYDDSLLIQNVSLFLDGVFNQTNTGGANGSYQFTNDVTVSDGKHNYSILAFGNDSSNTSSATREFWMNTTPALVLTAPIDYANLSYHNIKFNLTATEAYDVKNVSFYLNGTLNETDTSGTSGAYVFSKYLVDGYYNWSVTAFSSNINSTVNQSATRNLTIDTVSPAVTITAPPSVIEFQQLNHNVSLNWTSTDTHLSQCVVGYNSSNSTVTCGDETFDINITSSSQPKNLTFWVNDTFGNINTTDVSWDYRLFLESEIYSDPVYEGATTTFYVTLLTNGTDINFGNLSYDSKGYTGTITTNSANNFTLSRSLVVPNVASDKNVTFFWNITQGDFNYAIPSHTQNISSIGIDDCTANTIVLYNFTIVDEETQTKLLATNASGKVDISIYTYGTTTELINFNNSYFLTNGFSVCLNDSLTTDYNLDGVIEYDGNNTVKEFYNFQDEVISNATENTNITLYDLADGDSQAFKLIAKDSSYLALTDTLIKVYRKYIDEGVNKITEIPITDGNGETVAHLVNNDVIYTFVLVKGGTILKTFSDVRAVCQTPAITTCTIDFNVFSSGVVVPDYEDDEDLSFTLDYNETSRIIRSVYTIPSGDSATMVLTVIKEDAVGTSVCTDTSTSNADTLSCLIPNSIGNSTVIASITRDGTEVAMGQVKLDQSPSDIYGEVLVFLGLFVIFTLIGASITNNPVYTLIFFMLGVFFLFAINLVANNGFIGATATILWLLVAVILVMVKGARRN